MADDQENIKAKIDEHLEGMKTFPDSIGIYLNKIADLINSYGDVKDDKDAKFIARMIKFNASSILISKSVFFTEMLPIKPSEKLNFDNISSIYSKITELSDIALSDNKDTNKIYSLVRDTNLEIEELLAKSLIKKE